MAGVFLTGYEAGSTIGLINLAGTGSIQSTTKRTGTYGLQTNPTTTNTGYAGHEVIAANGQITTGAIATCYYTFYFRYGTKPAATDEPIFGAFNSSSVLKFEVRLDSAGNLAAYDSTPTIITTGATVLAADTWYCVEVKVGTGAGTGEWEIKINGTSEISGGSAQLLATNNALCRLGKHANRNGQTVNFYYDDFWMDDAAYKGAHAILGIKPTANGSTMVFTAGTGGSDYQEVDEIPLSTTDYVTSTAGAGEIALFAMQDTSTVGISGTINALKGMTYVAEDGAATTAANRIRVRSGGTNSSSNANNLSVQPTYTILQRLLEVDPATSVAWTTSGIDAVEVGSIEDNAVAVRLAWAFAEVSYTVATGTRLLGLTGVGT